MFTCLVCRTTLLSQGYVMTKACCSSTEAVCLMCHRKWCDSTRFYSCICIDGDHPVTWRVATVEQWKCSAMTFYSVKQLPSFHFNDVMNVKVLDVLGLNSVMNNSENISLSNLVTLVAKALETKKSETPKPAPSPPVAYLDAFTVFDYDL